MTEFTGTLSGARDDAPGRFGARRTARRITAGFTLVELMVALTLGMLLTTAMAYVYLSSRTAFARQQQLSSLQDSVRIAFENISTDTRTVGHMGCYTGLPVEAAATGFSNPLAATDIATNFAVGVEGYEYANATAGAYTLTSSAPANSSTAGNWKSNVAPGTSASVPIARIAGAAADDGLTPGSDVLVIRGVSGRPVRLGATANTGANQSTFTIETGAGDPGVCSNNVTPKVSGFCANSYGLIASCSRARVFQVSAVAAGAAPAASTISLPATATLGNDPVYPDDASEVFPLQTVAYYVKRSSSGTSTSLYRRIFDGDHANGLEQELVEGVESLQLQYGVDTTLPDPDGVVDQYVVARGPTGTAADSVTDWGRVVSVRIGLLLRSTAPVEADLASSLATSGLVNGVTMTYPGAGPKFDRRVFTTTVAVRNKTL